MEFVTGMNAFRHFQVMSNELWTPKILVCPAESGWTEKCATNFTAFSNSNISYFVGIVPNDNNTNLILSGDQNITNGTVIKNGILTLTTNEPAGWTSKFHDKVGNILLADGSVQGDGNTELRQQIARTGIATNRVQMPVLGP
jgi:prepilin-type processing-associated H-X9-DG protein